MSNTARHFIEDVSVEIFFSQINLMEIAIKLAINKLQLGMPFADLPEQLKAFGFEIMPLSFAHLVEYISLPLHHRDPFDRFLISQSVVEKCAVIGNDIAFDLYPIQRIW